MAFRSTAGSVVQPLVLTSLLVVGARTACAQVTFSEQNFAPGSFSVTRVSGGGGGSASQVPVGAGNPGPSLAITHTLDSGPPLGGFCARWEWTFLTMTDAIANPATLGGIASIDFSLDSAWIASSPVPNLPQSQTALVVQNGRLYISTRAPGVIGGGGAWSTTTMNALLASEFVEVVNLPPCQFSDSTQHPDFSPTGAPLQLGFARGNSTSVGGNPSASAITHAADNWSMTVYPCGLSISQQPVPVSTCPSGTAAFSATGAGTGPFTYRWQWQPRGSPSWVDVVAGVNADPVSGQPAFHTSGGHATETIEIVVEQFPPERLRCIVGNACSAVTSDAADLLICAADFNCDHQVDDSDFVLFAAAYDLLVCDDPFMPAGCPADMNKDGFVDDTDFVLFAAAYDTLLCP